jgi:hypothetical protein
MISALPAGENPKIASSTRLALKDHPPGSGKSGAHQHRSGLLAGPGSIIERRNWTISERPLNTALNGLMVHPHALRHRKKGWVISVRQQHSRPLHPARRFRSRAGNNLIACRHAVMRSTLSANQSRKPRTHAGKCESSTYDGFHGIDVLDGDAKGKGTSGSNREAESTDAPARGGLHRSSDEAG